MDEKEKEALEKVKAAQKQATDEATKGFKAQLDNADEKIKAAETRADEAEKKAKELEKNQDEMQKHLDQLDVELQGTKTRRTSDEDFLAKALKEAEENGDLKKAMDTKSNSTVIAKMEIKAVASPMTVGSVGGNADLIVSREVDGGINRPNAPQRNVLNNANVRATTAATIEWVNRENSEGNAEFLGEGELKPLRSFEYSQEESKAKKVAVAFKVTTESLQDISILADEIRQDGIEAVEDEVNDKLLNGDGTIATEPKGLIVQAAAFNVVGLTVANPNNYDAIVAASLQVSMLRHTPNIAFVNSIDFTNLALTKGSDGHYIMPLFATKDGERIQIAEIRVVKSDEIEVGSVLVGDMRKFHVRPYGPYTIEIGTENDDLRKNLRTIIVERRLHAYIKKHDKTAFVYDTFDNIKAAIVADEAAA
ncbi:phage major capsid protein [Sphingobacterium corticis]|uniref:Phage major capsid protein n=1 Tax=Sphingobacterium corticis TaxID=1812823 RepID=A0ABW5NI07_9SPHI